MEKFKVWKDSEPVRLYLYSVLVPALVVLAAKGVISSDDVVLYSTALAAILGIPAVEKVRSLVDSPSTARAKHEALDAEVELNANA